jgi:hypothetical protein
MNVSSRRTQSCRPVAEPPLPACDPRRRQTATRLGRTADGTGGRQRTRNSDRRPSRQFLRRCSRGALQAKRSRSCLNAVNTAGLSALRTTLSLPASSWRMAISISPSPRGVSSIRVLPSLIRAPLTCVARCLAKAGEDGTSAPALPCRTPVSSPRKKDDSMPPGRARPNCGCATSPPSTDGRGRATASNGFCCTNRPGWTPANDFGD